MIDIFLSRLIKLMMFLNLNIPRNHMAYLRHAVRYLLAMFYQHIVPTGQVKSFNPQKSLLARSFGIGRRNANHYA